MKTVDKLLKLFAFFFLLAELLQQMRALLVLYRLIMLVITFDFSNRTALNNERMIAKKGGRCK